MQNMKTLIREYMTGVAEDKRICELKEKTQKALLLRLMIEAYIEVEPTGGNCHIVLEDGNYDKNSINYCLCYSREKNDFIGAYICVMCFNYTEKELEIILEQSDEIINYFENQE